LNYAHPFQTECESFADIFKWFCKRLIFSLGDRQVIFEQKTKTRENKNKEIITVPKKPSVKKGITWLHIQPHWTWLKFTFHYL
jgi:hypothetical protein